MITPVAAVNRNNPQEFLKLDFGAAPWAEASLGIVYDVLICVDDGFKPAHDTQFQQFRYGRENGYGSNLIDAGVLIPGLRQKLNFAAL